MIELQINVGSPLQVRVVEFQPLDLAMDIRHAFQPRDCSSSNNPYKRQQTWNPPIIMFVPDGRYDMMVTSVQKNITNIFDQVLDDRDSFVRWTTDYFEREEEDFQTTILGLVGEYFSKDVKEHSILQTGLRLLWYEYLLLYKFTIPPTAVPELEANLEAERPASAHQDIPVIPDTINRFLKATILVMAEKAAEELTKNLHDTLFKMAVSTKNSSGHRDLILCMLFILMIFLGRTQNALCLLAGTPAAEIDIDYTHPMAEAKRQEMEEKVTDYFLEFHRYTLTRMSSKPPEDVASPLEVHAKQFNLMGKLRQEIEEDYGMLDACSSRQRWSDKGVATERPDNLELRGSRMDSPSFGHMSVGRLCWKVFANVEST